MRFFSIKNDEDSYTNCKRVLEILPKIVHDRSYFKDFKSSYDLQLALQDVFTEQISYSLLKRFVSYTSDKQYQFFAVPRSWSKSDLFTSSIALIKQLPIGLQTVTNVELARLLLFFLLTRVPYKYYCLHTVQVFTNMLYSTEVGADFKYSSDPFILQNIYFLKLWHEIQREPTWISLESMLICRNHLQAFSTLVQLFQSFIDDSLFKLVPGNVVLPVDGVAAKVLFFFLYYCPRIHWHEFTDSLLESKELLYESYTIQTGVTDIELQKKNLLDISYFYYINMQFQQFFQMLIKTDKMYYKFLKNEKSLFAYDKEQSENYIVAWGIRRDLEKDGDINKFLDEVYYTDPLMENWIKKDTNNNSHQYHEDSNKSWEELLDARLQKDKQSLLDLQRYKKEK